jgi:tRNA-2-methylthio-N6-dimethylallyladenosine synthase
MARRVYIHTFGCQMNESDSLRMLESLANDGWSATGEVDQADLILLNTCAIREKAEQKLFSALGRYKEAKKARGTILGVAGCVAQQEKGRLLKRAPYVDFVLGPDNLAALPELVRGARDGTAPRVETAWMDSQSYVFPRADPEQSRGRVTAFVTAMKGCDNVCSFCVVPHTRGRELSRPYAEVVREVADLVEVGVREVTLIGQNVNSFSGGCDFPTLLRRVAAIPGLLRLRFTTSHPHDFGDELIRCFAELPSLCPHLHLPVQSGSDDVLERMRRDYTAAGYEAKIAALRAAVPHISLTSDIIVGFPGESDDDFEATLRLVERVRYDNLYSFLYSSRPHTTAQLKEADWGEVPDDLKLHRLERLQALQKETSSAIMAGAVGTEVEVLVEGASRTDVNRLCGHSPENRTVNFAGAVSAGALASVRIEASTPASLIGKLTRVISAAPAAGHVRSPVTLRASALPIVS